RRVEQSRDADRGVDAEAREVGARAARLALEQVVDRVDGRLEVQEKVADARARRLRQELLVALADRDDDVARGRVVEGEHRSVEADERIAEVLVLDDGRARGARGGHELGAGARAALLAGGRDRLSGARLGPRLARAGCRKPGRESESEDPRRPSLRPRRRAAALVGVALEKA